MIVVVSIGDIIQWVIFGIALTCFLIYCLYMFIRYYLLIKYKQHSKKYHECRLCKNCYQYETHNWKCKLNKSKQLPVNTLRHSLEDIYEKCDYFERG